MRTFIHEKVFEMMETQENNMILFGKVVSVKDDNFFHRIRCTVDGYTDQLTEDELPFYFPFYGVNFLPLVDDIVPLFVFDGNFSTAMYGRKVDVVSRELDEADYENYLEIFKRSVDDNNVQLTYTPSTGIELINKDSKAQIEIDKITLFVKENQIFMDSDYIKLGNENLEMSLLGDKTVDYLKEQIALSEKIQSEYQTLFTSIQSAAMGSPYTMAIGIAITSGLPTATASIKAQMEKCKQMVEKIQSKKVSNE